MNDIREKIETLNYEAEYLLDCLNDEAELYKGYILEDDYNKLEELKVQLSNLLKDICNIAKSKKTKAELEKSYLKYKKMFDNLYSCFVSQRTASMFNLASHTYSNNEELLISNTKKILDDCDIEDIRDALKGLNDNAKDNMCCLLLMGKLQLEYEAIDNFFKNTNTHEKFLDLLIDKIEEILPNSNIRKAIELEKHKIIDKSTVITEAEAGTEPTVRKRKSITEPIINELSNYAMPMYQTQVLNTFLGMSYKESDIAKGGNNHLEIEKDDIVNNLKLKKNDVTAIINLQDLNNIKLDAKAKKTLCILLNMLSEKMPYKKYLTEENAIKYSKYTLSLNQYMKERGLTDRTSAKKQLEESLNLLLNTKVYYSYYDNKDGLKQGAINILGRIEKVVNRGKYNISISPSLIEHLSFRSHLMNYNKNLLTINDRLYPSGFSLGHKLLTYARTNEHKPTKNTDNKYCIKIETLLKDCTFNDNDRNSFTERILDKFEDTLDELARLKVIKGSWEYCGEKRRTLTDEEAHIKTYDAFKKLYLLYELYDDN